MRLGAVVVVVVVFVSMFENSISRITEVPPIRMLVPANFIEATRDDQVSRIDESLSHQKRVELGLRAIMKCMLPEIPVSLKFVLLGIGGFHFVRSLDLMPKKDGRNGRSKVAMSKVYFRVSF